MKNVFHGLISVLWSCKLQVTFLVKNIGYTGESRSLMREKYLIFFSLDVGSSCLCCLLQSLNYGKQFA